MVLGSPKPTILRVVTERFQWAPPDGDHVLSGLTLHGCGAGEGPTWWWVDPPLPHTIDNDADEPAVCITHVRWARPCLAKADHDRPVACAVISDPAATAIIRWLHNGEDTIDYARTCLEKLDHGNNVTMVPAGKVVY